MAQSAPPPEDREAASSLGEITVTAQKRTENLQNVPLSVTSISAEQLSERGVTNAGDLNAISPSLTVMQIGGGALIPVIRGITTTATNFMQDRAIAFNLDGINLAHSPEAPSLLYDISRIEVLRGPQGTLYGRNTNGGALNVVTNAPTQEFSFKASAQVGNYKLFAPELVANVPLGPDYAIRAAVAWERHDGYQRDNYNNANNLAGRLRFKADPVDNLSILLTADYIRQKGMGNAVSICPPGSYTATYTANKGCEDVIWEPFSGTGTPPEGKLYHEDFGFYGDIEYKTPIGLITYLPSYRKDNYYLRRYTTPYGGTVRKIHSQTITQELRISSLPGSKVDWVAGLYYGNIRFSQLSLSTVDAEKNPGSPYLTSPYSPVDSNYALSDDEANKTQSGAAFGQVTVPFAERFAVTGGLRYSCDYVNDLALNAIYLTTPSSALTHSHYTKCKLNWKVGGEAHLGETMLYANASTGFRSGGFNPLGADTAATYKVSQTYKPETITAYQVGVKSRPTGNLQVNAELFYYDYRNLAAQQSVRVPQTITIMVNSQKARYYGAEIDATYAFSAADKIDLSVALLNAKYTEFVLSSVNYSGNTANNAPRYTIGAGYSHVFDIKGGGKLTVSARTQFVGKQWVSLGHEPGSRQAAYHQSSADVTYRPARGTWSVGGWLRNIENVGVNYFYVAGSAPNYQSTGSVGNPRAFGMKFAVEY